MSLILKGIDMPMETDYLRLALLRSGRDNEVLVFDDETNALIGQAIQIPKGHGRIIDAGKVYCYNFWEEQNLDEAPTILEAEE